MNKFYYFAYGSNMLIERLKERCPSAKFITQAYVCGYDLSFNKRSKDCSGKATIIENKKTNDKLYGVVFEIEKVDLYALDEAEGPGYERKDNFIVVKMKDDQEIEVTTYFAKQGAISEKLRPYSWYKQLVLSGAIQAKLPHTYRVKLMAVEAVHDPDDQRNEKAIKLLKMINIA